MRHLSGGSLYAATQVNEGVALNVNDRTTNPYCASMTLDHCRACFNHIPSRENESLASQFERSQCQCLCRYISFLKVPKLRSMAREIGLSQMAVTRIGCASPTVRKPSNPPPTRRLSRRGATSSVCTLNPHHFAFAPIEQLSVYSGMFPPHLHRYLRNCLYGR